MNFTIRNRCLGFLLLFTLSVFSCEQKDTQDRNATFLHLAHTRSYGDSLDRLMPGIENIDFKDFDVLMLGGDLVYESTGKRSTLEYLDSVFDLANDNTLWSLGNHDYQHHPEWIREVTKRATFYKYEKDGICFLVMDSQKDQCNTIGAQERLLTSTLDGLGANITHVLILHHKLLWMMDGGLLQAQINEVSNGKAGDCVYCVPENNFYTAVYPKLVEVQRQGIQVICIAGDIGDRASSFEHKTKDGIHFLASGLKGDGVENKVLVFEHDIDKKVLNWKFESLDSLLE